MNDDTEIIALVDRVEALESKIEALRPRWVRVTGRVATYFGVLTALTVSVVDQAYLVPWMAGALALAFVPEGMRLVRRRALQRERDLLIQQGIEPARIAGDAE